MDKERLPIESVKSFDYETENFIAEFLHDGERSEGEERTHCKVTRGKGDGEVQVILQIDGKPVVTHVFLQTSGAWLDFRRDLAAVLESPRLSTSKSSKRIHVPVKYAHLP